MKKLLVLLVVLGLVSSANAGVIDIVITSLNGNQIAPTHEITIMQSDTIDLQIVWTGQAPWSLFGLSSFVNKEGPGTLDMAARVIDTATYDNTLNKIGVSGGQQWIVEAASAMGAAGNGQTLTIVSNLLVHCDGLGDVRIWLTDYAGGGGSTELTPNFDAQSPTYGAGVLIHQIPEPMTLMLLGLGSLFLVRRKK